MNHPAAGRPELIGAVEDLQDALQRASAALARISAELPRIERLSAAFGELESIIAAGRQGIATAPKPVAPTDDTPSAFAPPSSADSAKPPRARLLSTSIARDDPPPDADVLTSLRLEVESRTGPLDLRAIDDAVTEHPAVRDVALLDYDGRRATLKVWITPPATAADVQQALSACASEIVSAGSEISIIALEDVA